MFLVLISARGWVNLGAWSAYTQRNLFSCSRDMKRKWTVYLFYVYVRSNCYYVWIANIRWSWICSPEIEVVEVEVILQPTVSRPDHLDVRHPSRTSDQFLFLIEIFFKQLWVCYFVEPSLRRGRVCNLLLLLVLASAVPLGYESHGAQYHMLLS
jgi:hypothetical protein